MNSNNIIKLPIVTNSSGACTVQTDECGLLYKIGYEPGTLDTGADLTFSNIEKGTENLLVITNAGTTATAWYPHGTAYDAAGASQGAAAIPMVSGVKLVVAGGGDALTGAAYLYFLD